MPDRARPGKTPKTARTGKTPASGSHTNVPAGPPARAGGRSARAGDGSARTGGPPASASARVGVRKTYKLFIGGAFPRSESGRSYPAAGPDGAVLAHVAMASRKDARDAVVAARKAVRSEERRVGKECA